MPSRARRDRSARSSVEAKNLRFIPNSDLGDASSVDRFVARTNELLDGGPLNALVNNAAVSPKTTYQVAQFWYNAFRYLVPGASCFEIEDEAIVHQSRE